VVSTPCWLDKPSNRRSAQDSPAGALRAEAGRDGTDELGSGRVQRRGKSAGYQVFRVMGCVPTTGQARQGAK